MAQTQTRQIHSEKWFNAKKKSLNEFQELMIKLKYNNYENTKETRKRNL